MLSAFSRNQIRARLAGQHGFTLVEAMVAIGVILASLMALAYTATIGFRYVGLARERQAATGIADQVMEQVRAIAWDRFTLGVRTSDLASDSSGNVLACSGIYYYGATSCTPAPNGEKVVTSPGLPNQCAISAVPCPLVPNTGAVSGTQYPTTYTWRVYVTTAGGIYKVYVHVDWAASQFGSSIARSVKTSSSFYNSGGCGGSTVHPFAGPCQATFTGSASVALTGIQISPDGSSFSGAPSAFTASLLNPAARVEATIEQVAQVSGSTTQAGAELVTSSTSRIGQASTSTSVDGAPPGTSVYQTGVLTPSASPTSLTTTAGSGTVLTVSNTGAGSDTGAVTSAVAPSGAQPCPATSGVLTQQGDGLPCAAGWSRKAATLSATLDVGPAWNAAAGTANNTATIASIGPAAAGNQSITVLLDRLVTPTDTEDGLRQTISRRIGTVSLFRFPSVCTTLPAGWDNTKGLIQITNYQDAATAAAGLTTSAPSSTVQGGGSGSQVQVWNGTGYTPYTGSGGGSCGGGSTNLRCPGTYTVPSVSCSATVGSPARTLTITFAPDGNLTRGGKNETSTGTSPRTSAQAQVGSPVAGKVKITVVYNNATKVSLDATLDLGTIVAKAGYTPAPSGG